MHWAGGLFWHVVLDYMCSGEKVLTSPCCRWGLGRALGLFEMQQSGPRL